MQDQIAEITGIKLDLVVGELYAQVVSALYLVLPPAEMQAGTESFFENLTGYVSGELPILEPRLGFAKTLTPEVLSERIVTALQVGASEAIDKTIPILERKTGEFVEEDVTQYLDQINQGRLGPLPTRLLTASVRGLAENRREQLVDALLGPAAATTDEATRLQIEAALAAVDLPSAISLATAERLRGRVTAAVSKCVIAQSTRSSSPPPIIQCP